MGRSTKGSTRVSAGRSTKGSNTKGSSRGKRKQAEPAGDERARRREQRISEQDLRRMTRLELLEIMVTQQERIEELEEELESAKEQLQDKEIALERSGSIAEAAMQLTGIFEKAQETADLYVYNVRRSALSRPEQEDSLRTAPARTGARSAAGRPARPSASRTGSIPPVQGGVSQRTGQIPSVQGGASQRTGQIPPVQGGASQRTGRMPQVQPAEPKVTAAETFSEEDDWFE